MYEQCAIEIYTYYMYVVHVFLQLPPQLLPYLVFVGDHCRRLQWVEAQCNVLAQCNTFLALFARKNRPYARTRYTLRVMGNVAA
jgi:hypothetical protein